MFGFNTTKITVFALVLGLFSMMAFPVKAELDSKVVDVNHILNNETRINVDTLLSQIAKEGRVDMMVFVVNQATKNPNELAKKITEEWEIKHPGNKNRKRSYLVINASLHQGVIVLSKEVLVDDSLQYALTEIQQKILAPRLLEEDINHSVYRACAAIAGALEDWPSASSASLLGHIPSMTYLKWLAQLCLAFAAIAGLRVLFSRPKWQDMPISDEALMLLNQEASLGMSIWRAHRHIESV